MSGELVIATGNPGKRQELEALLAGLGLRLRLRSEFSGGDPAETAVTYLENALIKARDAAAASGLPALADDSGLEVDALGGAPGVLSARYAGEGASDADRVARLLKALDGVEMPQRTARFRCVAVYVRSANDAWPLLGFGTWEGRIATAPRGALGFGYDPIFELAGVPRTAAELPAAEKLRLSHRGQALAGLRASIEVALSR